MRLLAFFLLMLPAMPAFAAVDDVPEHIQGKWVSQGETCDAAGAPLVISATTLVYPDGTIDDVFFSPEDGADGALLFREEGVVTSYEYVEAADMLIFHPEGFGMMGADLPMVRCPEPADALERRCGWLANLTPGDWWLVDRDRTWVLAAAGDDNAATIPVMDRVPGFDADQFVSTGTYYGYGCACLNVATDEALGRITAIASSRRLPLATCEADRSLPPPGDW